MKAARFEYLRPASVQEAMQMLDSTNINAKAMAGSQSMGPMMNMRLTRPQQVVDLSSVAALQTVTADAQGITIGAAVTHAQIEDGVHGALHNHPVREVACDIAYRAVRNRGTLGGSLAHADPAADWVVVLSAFDAQINIVSNQAARSLSIHEFLHGAYTTDLASNELIRSITLPNLANDLRWAYIKFCRKPGEFAHASAAVRFEASSQCARIVLGALDGAPQVLNDLAVAIAKGDAQAATRTNLMAAVQQVIGSSDVIQVKLHAVALERALQQSGVLVGQIT